MPGALPRASEGRERACACAWIFIAVEPMSMPMPSMLSPFAFWKALPSMLSRKAGAAA